MTVTAPSEQVSAMVRARAAGADGTTSSPAGVGRLLVVSHVRHYRHRGCLYAYTPYAREIEIWAELFPQVTIASPCVDGPPEADCSPIARPNVSIVPQLETGGTTRGAKLRQVLTVPRHVWRLTGLMREAEAIHVRCPGNLGLLGVLLAPLFSRRLVAKYAGEWGGHPHEAWTWRLQRWLLGSRWWRGPVTVYGRWPKQPSHVVSFFTSVMTEAQLQRGQTRAETRTWDRPLRVLYVGRLSSSKNVDVLLRAVAAVRAEGHDLRWRVVGDGPERPVLEALRDELGLADSGEFTGALDFEQVLDHYESCDILALVSETEGWPKCVAEAMAFGMVCIGSDRGMMPEMLGENRGLTVPAGDVAALTDALRRVADAPTRFLCMSRTAAAWAEQFSLEGLREAIRELLADRWPAAARSPGAGSSVDRWDG